MKNCILSGAFGCMSTFLPFWEWDSIQTQFICGFAITILVLGLLEFADEMEEKYGRK